MKRTILVLALTFFSCNSVFAQKDLNIKMLPPTTLYSAKINSYDNPLKTRTVRDFSYRNDAVAVSDNWAINNNFVLVSASNQNFRIYKKGRNFFSASTICEIKQYGGNVHIEAYIKTGKLWEKLSFHHLPSEMKITPGGLKFISARATGRYYVNRLLTDFNRDDLMIKNVLTTPTVNSL